MNIEGRTVLVTGASRGLGRTLSLAFADAGARQVFAGARKESDLGSLSGDRITPIKLDVTSDDDINATRQLGAIDILVNNAGVASY